MIRFEAVNAKHGDAILLQYATDDKKGFWIIDDKYPQNVTLPSTPPTTRPTGGE